MAVTAQIRLIKILAPWAPKVALEMITVGTPVSLPINPTTQISRQTIRQPITEAMIILVIVMDSMSNAPVMRLGTQIMQPICTSITSSQPFLSSLPTRVMAIFSITEFFLLFSMVFLLFINPAARPQPPHPYAFVKGHG